MAFIRFLIWSSGSPLVWGSQTISATLVTGIKWNNPGNIFKFGPVVQEEMSFKEKVYGRMDEE